MGIIACPLVFIAIMLAKISMNVSFRPSFQRTTSRLLFSTASAGSSPRLFKEVYDKVKSDWQRKSEFVTKVAVQSFAAFSTTAAVLRPADANAVISPTGISRSGPSNSDDNTVVKVPSDDRQYKAITLPNGLRVLLISDKHARRAAAAMDVHVGSFSDPDDVPGLAHFCEHMLFLGTEKYPSEEEYSNYLSAHGGSSNAYTDSEDTVYFFDVNAEHFNGALDRFAQFFIAPQFTPEATSRELNAIDSEHSKNINNDGFRLYQLEKDLANPNHPLHKFPTGNKFTLETETKRQNIDIRQQLLDFHKQHYLASQMTLTILGRENLFDLEKSVNELFQSVPNSPDATDPAVKYWGIIPPYIPQAQNGKVLEAVSIGQLRSLSVSWPLWIKSSDEKQILEHNKPAVVLSHLLGHESKDSLRHFLAEQGLANSVGAFIAADNSDLETFEISVDLTEKGLDQRDEVLKAIFAAVDLLQKQIGSGSSGGARDKKGEGNGLPSYIQQEIAQLSKLKFMFSERSEAINYVSSLASSMQKYRLPKEYITGNAIFNGCSDTVLQNYIQQLTPENARITVVAPDLVKRRGQDKFPFKIAPYYNTQYRLIDLIQKEKVFNSKSNLEPYNTVFALPRPNPFIPMINELTMLTAPPTEKGSEEYRRRIQSPPTLTRQDERAVIWHHTDDIFGQPRIYCLFSLAVPMIKYEAPFVMTAKLFVLLFQDLESDFLYEARLTGRDFSVDFTSRGMQIVLGGFSDKQQLFRFAQEALQRLASFNPTNRLEAFERVKDQLRRELQDWKTEQPYEHATYYTSLATETLQFPIPVLQAALEDVTPEKVGAILKDNLLDQSYIVSLCAGNLDKNTAEQLTSLVEKCILFKQSLPLSERAGRKIALLPVKNKGSLIRKPEPNANDDNSCATLTIQIDGRIPSQYIPSELLAEILEQPYYTSLRTKQQLGYLVFSGARGREGTRQIVFTVQSSLLGGSELAARIEKFIQNEGRAVIAALTPETLQPFIDSLAAKKLEPPERLTQLAGRMWGEIVLAQQQDPSKPLFTRAVQDAEALKKITPEQLLQFFDENVAVGGRQRRAIITEVTSQKRSLEEKLQGDAGYEIIVGEEVDFLKTLPLV